MNQRQDIEQLRKELKRWEGEGKAKKVDIGDADEYQVRLMTGVWQFHSQILVSDCTNKILLSS